VVAEELAKAGVPAGNDNDIFSIGMIGHTLIEWGTEEQKAHFLPRILDGSDVWCQGYSEPNSGSDLASLATRAVLDGDEWIINGQKIWTSQGHNANWIFVLCRTSPERVKQAGISFLLCPIDQPGIEVRPILNAARLQRGVLHRCAHRPGKRGWRGRQRLGRRQHPAGIRTG
jgi:alkylation response protein AidB-like acyl-CoA dehydrogenase